MARPCVGSPGEGVALGAQGLNGGHPCHDLAEGPGPATEALFDTENQRPSSKITAGLSPHKNRATTLRTQRGCLPSVLTAQLPWSSVLGSTSRPSIGPPFSTQASSPRWRRTKDIRSLARKRWRHHDEGTPSSFSFARGG
jgi:hypothetical protein